MGSLQATPPMRQFVALVPLSHRATTVQRSIGWPVSKFWTPVELLRVVQILDNFPARVRTLTNLNIQLSQVGTTPARIVLQNAAPPFSTRSIRARMYGFFIFQHRQRLRDLRFFKVFAPCDRLRILPIISATSPVAQMVGAFPRSLRPLAGPVAGFTLWGDLPLLA